MPQRILSRVVFGGLLIAAHSCGDAPPAPDVLGVRFATSISDLSSFLPAGAKPQSYPLVPIFGYILSFPNPENWTVFVADSSGEDFLENRVYAIAISRNVGHECTSADVAQLTSTLASKYASHFKASFVEAGAPEAASADSLRTLIAASERRMLIARVSCFVDNVGASIAYLDLDRYRYRKPEEIAQAIASGFKHANEFNSRSLGK